VGIPQGKSAYKQTVNNPRAETFLSSRIAAVPEDMLKNVMQNFEERLQMRVQQEGHHLTDILFCVIKNVLS
jgi:hypothetical protein